MNTLEPINSTGRSKTKLREKLKAVRSSLSEEEVQAKSVAIIDRLKKGRDWTMISHIHLYLPITNNKEVDTWSLVEWIWANHSNATTSTSIYGESKAIQHAIIRPDTEFKDDSMGIPMPISGYRLEPLEYDLIIVPTLGFDENLNRIGYGRGVYDSFLAKQPGAKKIGLAYEDCRVKLVPVEPHDELLSEIVTEAKQYSTSRQ